MILVTGGTGLIGSHLLYKLIGKNEPVRAIYRTERKLEIVKKVFSYYTTNVESAFNAINWVQADLNDIPLLTEAFKDITHVYHVAAFVSFEPDKYLLLRRTNIEGTANIVNLCIAHHIEKLCYVSSIIALGSSLNNEPVTEKTPWNSDADHSVYGITKYGAEIEVWRGTQEGLDVVVVNPGVVLGAGIWRYGSGNIFKKVFKGIKYYTNGTTGLVDIEDVTTIMIALMRSEIKNERYILVAENWSYKQFLTTIAKNLKVGPPKKEAPSWMLQLIWRLDWLQYKLTGKRRTLTRQLTCALETRSKFDNNKIKKTLQFEFKPITQSIAEVSTLFLEENDH